MTDRLASYLADAGLALRLMDDEHYVDFFDCGRDPKMDAWFGKTALKWQQEDMCSVWVLSPLDRRSDPLGFFTLSPHQIVPSNVAKSDRAVDPRNKPWVNGLQRGFPAHLLGKFALHMDEQGKGLAQVLMTCVYSKHVEAAAVARSKFLVVDVQDERLVRYYRETFGFARSHQVGDLVQMYRPTSVIRQELASILG